MVEANIDTLNIEIVSESEQAVKKVEALSAALQKLKGSLEAAVSTDATKRIKELTAAMKQASTPQTKAMDSMKQSMGQSGNASNGGSGGQSQNISSQAQSWKNLTKEIMDARNQIDSTTIAVQKMQTEAESIDWGKVGDTEEMRELQNAVKNNVADMERLKQQVDINNQAFLQMGGVINSTSANMGKIYTNSKEAQQGLSAMSQSYQRSIEGLAQTNNNAINTLERLKMASQAQAKAEQRAVEMAKLNRAAAQRELQRQAQAEKAAAQEAKAITNVTQNISKSFMSAQIEANKMKAELDRMQQSVDAIDLDKFSENTDVQNAISAFETANSRLEDLRKTSEEAQSSLKAIGATLGETSVSFGGVDTSNQDVVSGLRIIENEYDTTIKKAKESIAIAKTYKTVLAQAAKATAAESGPEPSDKGFRLGNLQREDVAHMQEVRQELLDYMGLVPIVTGYFSKMANSLKQIKEHPLETLKASLEQTGQTIKKVTGFFGKLIGAVGRVSANTLKKAWDSSIFHRFGESVKEARKKYESFKRSIACSIIYRVLGASISMMTQNIKEGIDNLYQYSTMAGTMFAPAMNSLATSALYLRNAFATVAAPLIEAVAPAVDFLIDKFVALLNIIGKVFAALTGKSTFTQAKKHAVEYGDAIKGADKALKSFTIGIDELNIIEDSAGAAGGAMEDFGNMFEEVEIDNGTLDWAKAVRDAIANGDWYGAGTLLADKLNEVVDSWDTESWGIALGNKINNAVDLGLGFLRTVDTENYGGKLAEFINGIVHTVNWDSVGELMGAGFNRALDFVKGFLEKVDASAIGQAIAKIFKGFFTEINWDNIVETLRIGLRKIREFLNGFLAELGEWTEPLRNAITKIEGDIQKAITATKNWAADLNIEPLKEAWGSFVEVVSKLAEVLSGAFLWAYENVLLPFGKWSIEKGLPTLLEKLSEVISGLTGVLEGVAPYAKQFYEEFLLPIGKWIWEKVIGFISDFSGSLKKIGDALKDRKSLSEFWDSLSTGEKKFVTFAGVIVGASGVVGALSALKTALDFLASPKGSLGLIITAVALLITKFVEWYDTSPGFRKAIDLIGKAFGALLEMVDWVIQKVRDGINAVRRFLGMEEIPDSPKDVLANKIKPALDEMERVQNAHLGTMTATQTAVYAAQKKNAEDHGIDLSNGIGFGLGEIINKTNEWSDQYDLSVRHGVGRAQVTANEKMKDMEGEFVNGYANIDQDTTNGFNDIETTMGGKMDDMKKTADNKLDDLDTAMKTGYTDINTSTGNEWDKIVGTIETTIGTAITKAPEWGRKITDGIAQGIRNGIGAVKLAMNALTEGMAEYIHHSEPDVGPLKDDSTYMPDMMKSFAGGIKDGTPKVVDEVVSMADQVSNGVTGTLKTVGEQTTSGMSSLSQTLLNGVQNAIQGAVHAVQTTFESLGKDSSQWGNQIAEEMAKGLLTGAEAIKAAVEYIANIIKSALSFNVSMDGPLEEAKDTIPQLMNTYTTDYKKFAPKLTDQVIETASKVSSGIGNVVTEANTKAESGLGAMAKNLMERVKGTINNTISNIKDTLSQTAVDSTTYGSNISTNVAEGIEGTIGLVKDAVNKIANTIESRLSFGQKLEGPLKDSEDYMPNMMQSFAQGIEANTSAVVNKVVNLGVGMVQSLTTTFANIDRLKATAWRNIHSDTTDNLNRLNNTVIVQMQMLFSALQEIFNALQQNAFVWGNQFSNRIADGIMAGAEKVAFAASFIASQIQQRIGFSEPSLGPLSDFHTYMPDMLDLMSKGIKDNAYKVLSAVRALSSDIADSVDEMAHTQLTFPVHEVVTVDYRNVQNAPDGNNQSTYYVDDIDTDAVETAMKNANSDMLAAVLSGVEMIVNAIDSSSDRPIQVSLDGKRMDRAQEKRQRQKGADIMGKGVTVY